MKYLIYLEILQLNILHIEQELDHVFVLTDPENEVYRCKYCEEKYRGHRNK